MSRPAQFTLSYTLEEMLNSSGELHMSAPLARAIIKVAKIDEELFRAAEKLVHELKDEMEKLKDGGSVRVQPTPMSSSPVET